MSDLVEKFVSACETCDISDIAVMSAAIDAGVDVNAENSEGFTALHAACCGIVIYPEKEKKLDLLLKHPQIDINKPSSGNC